jgi:adhesin transport system outer membrane protein
MATRRPRVAMRAGVVRGAQELLVAVCLLQAATLAAAPDPARSSASPDDAAAAQNTLPLRRLEARVLIREALQTYPSVLAARRAQDSAQFDVQTARWQFYPTPSVGFEAASRKASSASNQQSGFVRMRQPLWTGGRLARQVDRAMANEQISGSQVEEERRELALRIIQALGEVRTAALKRAAYRASGALHVEYLALVQRRVAEGMSPQGDIVLARSRLSSVRADLEAAEVQQAQAIARLEQLLGRSLQIEEYAGLLADARDDATSVWADPGFDVLLTQALEVSPVVRRGRFELDARKAEVDLARASTSPEVYLRAEHTRGNLTAGETLLFVGVSSNFGPGLSDQSGVNSALQRVEAKSAENETRRREVADQVRADHLSAEASARRVQILADSAELAQTVLVTWRRQFLAGRKTWQDLMNAAREKAQADVLVGESRAALWAAVQRLRIATEGVDAYLDAPAVALPRTAALSAPGEISP